LSEFSWPLRVYYEDTDAGGVVYHASYVRFFERGRTEWLRSLGYSQARLVAEEGVLFSVVSLEIDYQKPARLDDQLQVVTRVQLAGGASVRFEQDIRRDGEQLAQGTVLVACVDAQSFKPKRLPVAIGARIA
jgi:acyl-CoA thioester hydrolase